MLQRSNWFCTNILIIRHGQSDNNTTYELVRERFGDSLSPEEFEVELNKLHNPDCGMSAIGHRQAKNLADFVAANKLHVLRLTRSWKIWTSPMKRCLLTTQYLTSAMPEGTEVHVHPRFFESDGCYKKAPDGTSIGLPGMTAADVAKDFPTYHCLPGMEQGWYAGKDHKETAGEFKERVEELVQTLWNLHQDRLTQRNPSSDDKDVGYIIVAHGNLLRALVSRLLGTYAMITADNTGVTHIQLWSDLSFEHRLASLQFLNRVDHLVDVEEGKLISGGEIFDDHWIQEYLVSDDE